MSALRQGPTLSREQQRLIRVVNSAADLVDRLYEAHRLREAEDLDALLFEAEELLEDNGDCEENGDLENDLLSEVDESGAHERPTELPECEVHDDDLDFAYDRGRYAPERIPGSRRARPPTRSIHPSRGPAV